ncbi:MAG: hypothetical protein IPK79_00125 [Vampirovibrionales bacterium]|nr:hypothetical protein [Vampirovibrionales bacterium]
MQFVNVPGGDRVCLSKEDAIAMIAPGESVHVVSNVGNIFIGADWLRADVIAQIYECVPEEAGPIATAEGYGLVIYVDGAPYFVKTVKQEDRGQAS